MTEVNTNKGNLSDYGKGRDQTDVSADEAMYYLEEIRYPADRTHILDYARRKDAPDEVLARLQLLSARSYASAEALRKAIAEAGGQNMARGE